MQNTITITPQSLDALTFPLYGMRLIEASAGTGKTYTIASLFIRLLLGHGKENSHQAPLTVDKILVVTFTEAATAELRSRIRERIIEVRLAFMKGESNDPFVSALIQESADLAIDIRLLRFAELQMDEASIYTIHGFCQRMLMQNAFESGSLFQQSLLEDDSQLLLQATNDFWRSHFYDLSVPLTELIYSYWQHPEQLKNELRSWLSRHDVQFLPKVEDFDFKAKYANSLSIIEKLKNNWLEHEADYFDIISHSDVSKRSYTKKNLPKWLKEISDWAFVESSALDLPKNLQKFSQKTLDEKTPKGATPTHAVFTEIEEILALDLSIKNTILVKATNWVRENLQRNKQSQSLLGFDDLLNRLDDALQNSPDNALAEQVKGSYPIALIDEFQDTDPVQYRIFQTIYQPYHSHAEKSDNKSKPENQETELTRDSGLFMIGDPKQAIYSFRGADIFTYMKARKNVSAHYSLDYNYRSSPEMINAVNSFFEFCPSPFIYDEDIPFIAVKAPDIKRKKLVTKNFNDPTQTALQFIHPVGGENADGFKQSITLACVNEIKNLLMLSQQGKAYIQGKEGHKKPLRANDIAILVRTGKEAALIRKALLDENINSVYLSLKESVYATPLAKDLLYILKACLNPEDERLLRSAIGCKLFALSPVTIHQLLADTKLWEQKIAQFFDYQALWNKSGVLVMLHKLFNEQGINQQLLQDNKGERLLTDLLHLTELLQKNSVEHDGGFALLRWFADQVTQVNSDNSEQKQRLESEKDLIQVSTLHKSKGLEYDIVFMPFTGLYQKPRDCLYHDPDKQHTLFYDLQNNREHVALAEKEQLAEDLRLLYVGLTRSVYRCYIGISSYKTGRVKNSPLAKSALGYICLQTGKDLLAGDTAGLNAQLEKMQKLSINISVRTPPESNDEAYSLITTDTTLQAPREFNGKIERNWWISSYSSLSRFHTGSHQTVKVASEVEHDEIQIVPEKSPFSFPRGAKHGSFLHLLFELIDFNHRDSEQLSAIIEAQLIKHLYDDVEIWTPILTRWFEQILTFPLSDDLSLSTLLPASKKVEMQFFIDMKPLHAYQVNQLIKQHDPLSKRAGELQFISAQGFLKGFIDLTFEFKGKYYLLDYKSNYLGDTLSDYNQTNIENMMIEHRYDFQYQLYTLALHRLLRSRLPDYDYELHIGGVYYTFIRGMQDDNQCGVYFNKPSFALIDGLDKLFNGEQAL
ncbi:exodeoxyribonuclease V subunit beta [Psychromonas sp. psych-6C06]|uniref:exodeoxyribonuclease V subunit beta n=1 Tax=Psychromonas sp. psych-6C06 TaxID=2058089 RepID=UPI000C345934|nr:exodeoxyribonuclease V subunit beta [Psychromonas sp. psych-6C06]PKF63586.1 exodeoxyribonuclease V subunit beta [Psychromonas sp. psych-6C06]